MSAAAISSNSTVRSHCTGRSQFLRRGGWWVDVAGKNSFPSVLHFSVKDFAPWMPGRAVRWAGLLAALMFLQTVDRSCIPHCWSQMAVQVSLARFLTDLAVELTFGFSWVGSGLKFRLD